jgi:Ca2+-binding RTX toxin-like protein
VQSTVSYTLGANIEKLVLLGTAGMSGTGNALANVLIGNSGANKLSGLGGNDIIDGRAGNDTLTGGAGADVFLFSKGSGKDTVTDFVASTDRIDFSNLAAITDFTDLMKNHAVQSGDDVLIKAGTDVLTLKHVDLSDLSKGDFLF